jgi:hypothetical protein
MLLIWDLGVRIVVGRKHGPYILSERHKPMTDDSGISFGGRARLPVTSQLKVHLPIDPTVSYVSDTLAGSR